ncbi:hypothetical protein ACTXT7_003140 [Hymenolepis weldensis]
MISQTLVFMNESLAKRWIHISGSLTEKNVFAVVFPENPNVHPVVLSFLQEDEIGSTDQYTIRSGIERVKRYVIPEKRYITTSQAIEHRKSEQWFYTSGTMQKSPLKLRVKHFISIHKAIVKDLVFEPSNFTLDNPNYSYIQRIFFQPAHERAFKQTSISGTATPPLYVIMEYYSFDLLKGKTSG